MEIEDYVDARTSRTQKACDNPDCPFGGIIIPNSKYYFYPISKENSCSQYCFLTVNLGLDIDNMQILGHWFLTNAYVVAYLNERQKDFCVKAFPGLQTDTTDFYRIGNNTRYHFEYDKPIILEEGEYRIEDQAGKTIHMALKNN